MNCDTLTNGSIESQKEMNSAKGSVPHMKFANGSVQERRNLDEDDSIMDEIASKSAANSYRYTEGTVLQGSPHRPLTPLRIVQGLLCLFVLLTTAFFMLVFLAPICCLLVRFVSRRRSRESVAFFFGHWLAMWPFLFENINETKVVFSGDKVPSGERVVVMCNHRTEVDWMYIWNLALRKARIGYVKYIVKNSVRDVPVFGWALHALEFLLIERKWNVDEPLMNEYLESFIDRRDPLWLVLFPEGTDYTEMKKLAGQEFSERRGLPKLNHVLVPRPRGFFSCITRLRDSLDAVYDLTIAYKNRCPTLIDNLFGLDPAEVHIHIQRIPVKEVPTSEEECFTWLYNKYLFKDELLNSFNKKGFFTSEKSIEGRLKTSQFFISFIGIVACTLVLWYLMCFSSIWIKVYFGVSCVYFAIVSHFGWRPRGRAHV